MDHDSLSLAVDSPASSRIADIREAYLLFAERGLELMNGHIDAAPIYRSNEEGHLAWDQAQLIQASCLTWRLTGNVDHLGRAAHWASALCEATDEKQGIHDWRGQSGPVWSAGSRYTAGIAEIGLFDSHRVQLQAVADTAIILRPSSTTASVAITRDGRVLWRTPEVSLIPGESTYLPDYCSSRSAIHSVQFHGTNESVDLTAIRPGEYKLEPRRAPHLIHTGLIARSLLDVANALATYPDRKSLGETKCEDLIDAAKRAIDYHDSEIIEGSDYAWYITPLGFPGRRTGMWLPHNHVASVITCQLILARQLGDPARLDLARHLSQPFKEEIRRYSEGDLPHPWYYYPVDSDSFDGVNRHRPLNERIVTGAPRAEDSSHATIRVRALAEWKTLDDVIMPDAYMQSLARTFRELYLSGHRDRPTVNWLPSDNEAERLGQSDTYAGAWSRLAIWDTPNLKRRLNRIAEHNIPTRVFGATVLSAAEIVAVNSTRSTYASLRQTAPR